MVIETWIVQQSKKTTFLSKSQEWWRTMKNITQMGKFCKNNLTAIASKNCVSSHYEDWGTRLISLKVHVP